MTDKAMSPLRQRMIEDMTIRKFAPKTQHDYLQRVLSRLFRRLFLERLLAAHQANRLKFFGDHAALADADVRGVSGTATPSRMGGLCQAPVTASPSPTAA